MKFSCPCCRFLTYETEPGGTFEICPVCFWEDDDVQLDDPEFEGGANVVSLFQARLNFKKFGASDKKFINKVRKPNQEEIPTST